ncbi:MAG TPA: hypothetical protein VGK81_12940 [Anaerolineae bacterium]
MKPLPHRKPNSHLRNEFDTWQALLSEQPQLTQRSLLAQARALAAAITEGKAHVAFSFPAKVMVELLPDRQGEILSVPVEAREYVVGGILDQITGSRTGLAIRQRLVELEQSTNRAIAVSAGLLRFATAVHMVRNMLPAGKSVTYLAEEGEDIPSIPVAVSNGFSSAFTAPGDAIAEEGSLDGVRGQLQVPYVPAAQSFYLPQWVAFGDGGALLVNSLNQAEAYIASMQNYLRILHCAVSLAPYMVADSQYQSMRYGLLGQLVNQGRALARSEVDDIIRVIQQRAAAHDLNRGLAISLPYFDDQALEMKLFHFEVIPAGRIMFAPAFIIRATDQEQAKVAQDTRLSHSTRRHLLAELKKIESAFSNPAEVSQRMLI